MSLKKLNTLLLLAIPLLLFFPSRAYAYLDPGSGSYLLQLLVAGLVTCVVTFKTFWSHVRNFFSRPGSRRDQDKSSQRS